MTESRDIKSLIRASAPSAEDEDLDAMDQRQHAQSFENPNSFHNWFPVVQSLGIRSPHSEWVEIDRHTQAMMLDGDPDALACDGLSSVIEAVRRFGQSVGFPVFLKTGVFSAKHDWDKSCFVRDDQAFDIARHIQGLFYIGALFGAPRSPHLVMREFIPTTPVFHAFSGNTPITQEFRLFTDSDRVVGYQPYWPERAIEDHEPSVSDWRERLRSISEPAPALFDEMRSMAEQVVPHLDGDWSVDFLIDDNNRPWLIDMAIADQSFCCPDGYQSL